MKELQEAIDKEIKRLLEADNTFSRPVDIGECDIEEWSYEMTEKTLKNFAHWLLQHLSEGRGKTVEAVLNDVVKEASINGWTNYLHFDQLPVIYKAMQSYALHSSLHRGEVGETLPEMFNEIQRQEHKAITGWETKDEAFAYDKGREDEQKVIADWISKWDGSTNSLMGSLLDSKMKELAPTPSLIPQGREIEALIYKHALEDTEDKYTLTRKAIYDIAKELSSPKAEKVEGWVRVSEQAPEEFQEVMFVVESSDKNYDGRVMGGMYQGIKSKGQAWEHHEFSTPGVAWTATLWQPLPAAPANNKGK